MRRITLAPTSRSTVSSASVASRACCICCSRCPFKVNCFSYQKVPSNIPHLLVFFSRLLTTCFTWEPPSTCPVSRFRITFFTCSVGFTTPMLFDEKKFPFHLMLYKFISLGGQNAFFDAFDWALESFKSEGQEIPGKIETFLFIWMTVYF